MMRWAGDVSLMGKCEMHSKSLSKNRSGRYQPGNLGIDGKVILNNISENICGLKQLV
jgi:hypothetical protein